MNVCEIKSDIIKRGFEKVNQIYRQKIVALIYLKTVKFKFSFSEHN
jgi:hypothetical protein